MDDCSNDNSRYQEETTDSVQLNEQEQAILEKQNSRIVSSFKAQELDKYAKKHWDIFYKRNGDRFFKDRHWTTREFTQLLGDNNGIKQILEIGCGVGNFIYPLIADGINAEFFACDFSPRAIECLKSNLSYNPSVINAFTCDIVEDELVTHIPENSLDMVTSIFVLSAVNPDNHQAVVLNIHKVLKIGGLLLFRDYGLHDMAQLRFKPGHKIADNFYMRQDGTRSYFFSIEYLRNLFITNGFKECSNKYVCKRTVNVKEEIDVPRRFIQATFSKQ
ncbi:tRNA N(3)-methylcytidine methyltransferase METTL6 [Adelges cooleyi]|uniref:tRNA N(3)-methylcytidine methyltransferase METTL6 n=1 Tax=Adelges cooleyi TaxID=133065 RepID=UPI00217FBBCE|nr:tRNA N(3)-methylcytidine methyltransferase METTL6 [Adelges cooleyi]